MGLICEVFFKVLVLNVKYFQGVGLKCEVFFKVWVLYVENFQEKQLQDEESHRCGKFRS